MVMVLVAVGVGEWEERITILEWTPLQERVEQSRCRRDADVQQREREERDQRGEKKKKKRERENRIGYDDNNWSGREHEPDVQVGFFDFLIF